VEAAGIEPALRMAASVVLLSNCINTEIAREHVGSARVTLAVGNCHSKMLTFEDLLMLGWV